MSEVLSFGDRLGASFDQFGRLCVGIDPHAGLLDSWGLSDDAEGVREFGLRVIDAAHGHVGLVKPQVSFFERFGSRGFAALERVLAHAAAAGLVVIGDVKRGDIGSTVEAYGDAWLLPGSPLEVDAITLSPYLGLGSLAPTLERAESLGKGVFVLAATSNPEGAAVQQAVLQSSSREGDTVAAAMVGGVVDWNARHADASESRFGSIGVVLGATLELSRFGIDRDSDRPGPTLPVLAPGFGSQGAAVSEIRSTFGAFAEGVIVSESRSLLAAGPEGITDAIARRVDEVEKARG